MTKREVWERAFFEALSGAATLNQPRQELAAKEAAMIASDAVRVYEAELPDEPPAPPPMPLTGIHPTSVKLLVDSLRNGARADAADVVEALFVHIRENKGLSPSWTPPERGEWKPQ